MGGIRIKGGPGTQKLLRIWLLFLFIATAYTLIMLSRPLLSGEEIEPGRVLATAVVGLLVAAGIFGVVWRAQAPTALRMAGVSWGQALSYG